jgi:choline transport protein
LTLLPTTVGLIGGFTIAGRTFYALARDNMTPFPAFFARLSSPLTGDKASSPAPFNATLLIGMLSTALGCIYLGSARAFNDIAASFVTLTSLSYLAAIAPHLFTRHRGLLTPGPFYMRGVVGYVVNAISVAYLASFCLVFCFPFSLPVTLGNMNYTVVIVVGLTAVVSGWWFARRDVYVGPGDLEGGVVKQRAEKREERGEEPAGET